MNWISVCESRETVLERKLRTRRLFVPLSMSGAIVATGLSGANGSAGDSRLMGADGAVDVEFFGHELGEHGLVAAAVGFGDLGAEFALATFEAVAFEGVEGVLDLGDERAARWARAMFKSEGEVGAEFDGGGASSGLGGAGAWARVSRRSAVARSAISSGWSASWIEATMRALVALFLLHFVGWSC